MYHYSVMYNFQVDLLYMDNIWPDAHDKGTIVPPSNRLVLD